MIVPYCPVLKWPWHGGYGHDFQTELDRTMFAQKSLFVCVHLDAFPSKSASRHLQFTIYITLLLQSFNQIWWDWLWRVSNYSFGVTRYDEFSKWQHVVWCDALEVRHDIPASHGLLRSRVHRCSLPWGSKLWLESMESTFFWSFLGS